MKLRSPRVAVLVDESASMTLAANTDSTTASKKQPEEVTSRANVASNILQNSDFLSALRKTHEVSVWSFSANSQKIAVLPQESQSLQDDTADDNQDWQEKLLPQGSETRLGDALLNVLRGEPDESLSGIIVLLSLIHI